MAKKSFWRRGERGEDYAKKELLKPMALNERDG